MSKIKEKLIEPVKIETGSIFKIKIKVVRGATYNEVETEEELEDTNQESGG